MTRRTELGPTKQRRLGHRPVGRHLQLAWTMANMFSDVAGRAIHSRNDSRLLEGAGVPSIEALLAGGVTG
jgi:hypothetical protein